MPSSVQFSIPEINSSKFHLHGSIFIAHQFPIFDQDVWNYDRFMKSVKLVWKYVGMVGDHQPRVTITCDKESKRNKTIISWVGYPREAVLIELTKILRAFDDLCFSKAAFHIEERLEIPYKPSVCQILPDSQRTLAWIWLLCPKMTKVITTWSISLAD